MKPRRNIHLPVIVLFALIISAAGCVPPGETESGFPGGLPTERVSVSNAGAEADGASEIPDISADGRFVAFYSEATNLVTGADNGCYHVYVRDRETDTIECVSVDQAGVQGNSDSYSPSISADGRMVAFTSHASNLTPPDGNGMADVFVYDRQARTIQRVSVDSSEAEASLASQFPAISADGRCVAFETNSSNLVANDLNAAFDIFVRDLAAGTTERVSVSGAGVEGNAGSFASALSADGRYVAFESAATNLVTPDANGQTDVFVYDRQTDAIQRVSVSGAGTEANGSSQDASISADGRYVAFESNATNLTGVDAGGFTDIFVRDRQNGATIMASVNAGGAQANGASSNPSIAGGGLSVSFESAATNLVAGDAGGYIDIFVRRWQSNTIVLASVNAGGAQANNGCYYAELSADGRYVAFMSFATNLDTGDTSSTSDVFAAPVP